MDNWKPTELCIRDRQSLIHLGSLDSFDITEGGKTAARCILSYLDSGSEEQLRKAVHTYEEIIPNENFGGEYTALEWLCKYYLSDEEMKGNLTKRSMDRAFVRLLTKDGEENLRTYLQYKYHIVEYGPGDNTALKARMRFLEDFILFNNPDRERWETTREYLSKFQLEKGMEVADVGCGSGYYTFRFTDYVGEEGRVYAIETNPLHLENLRDYVAENGIKNVEVVESSFEGIGLPPAVRVDVVYLCSLYHNVYAAFTDAERDSFVGSICRALRENGRLIIVDNDLVMEEELPYHGPYVHKDMLVSQLYYYGFRLRESFQYTPQRYGLIFDKVEIPAAGETPYGADPASGIGKPASALDAGAVAGAGSDGNGQASGGEGEQGEGAAAIPPVTIPVHSAASLVRYRIIGTSTSGYTVRGKRWGRLMHEGLLENDEGKLQEAQRGFTELYPLERVGDDYTALLWFLQYRLADEDGRKAMRADKLADYYCNYFCEKDFERLKTYLFYKFHLEKPDPADPNEDINYEYDGKDFPISTLNEWNEFLIFNNPNRVLWERTEEMLHLLGIREGETVADIGCGGGYFSYRFSQLVGNGGKVYSTEINKDALSYLEDFTKQYGIRNIETLVAKMNDASLPENGIDMAYMCSMYHAVYITDIEFVKDAFVESLRKALKPDGRLVIVDNNITEPPVPSYYGPGILPQLIIAQLRFYGFLLAEEHYLIPQRYVLVFKKDPEYVPPVKKEGGKKKDAQAEPKTLLR